LVEKIPMKDIFDEVEAVFGTKGTIGRNEKMFLSQRFTSEKLKDIGACFGIGESDFCQSSRRVKDRIRNDKKHGRKIAKIEKKIICQE
jgi:DNA-directed RNA polymerase specialized sigma subunit